MQQPVSSKQYDVTCESGEARDYSST